MKHLSNTFWDDCSPSRSLTWARVVGMVVGDQHKILTYFCTTTNTPTMSFSFASGANLATRNSYTAGVDAATRATSVHALEVEDKEVLIDPQHGGKDDEIGQFKLGIKLRGWPAGVYQSTHTRCASPHPNPSTQCAPMAPSCSCGSSPFLHNTTALLYRSSPPRFVHTRSSQPPSHTPPHTPSSSPTWDCLPANTACSPALQPALSTHCFPSHSAL